MSRYRRRSVEEFIHQNVDEFLYKKKENTKKLEEELKSKEVYIPEKKSPKKLISTKKPIKSLYQSVLAKNSEKLR
jgi:hypothetical protein